MRVPSHIGVLARPGVGVQFNTFPDRAIVLGLPPTVSAESVVRVFLHARTAMTMDSLTRELSLCGVPEDFGREMLWELLTAGMLEDASHATGPAGRSREPAPPVQILRSGVMGAAISESLAAASVDNEVVTYDLRISRDEPARGLRDLATRRGVLLTVGRAFLPTDAQAMLVNLGVIHLPGGVVDGELVLGPLVVPGRTACTFCVDQQIRRGDAGWFSVREQVAGRVPPVSTADARIGASLVAHMVSTVLLPWLSAPVQAEIPEAFTQQTRIMLHTLESQTARFDRLPRCPICWRA